MPQKLKDLLTTIMLLLALSQLVGCAGQVTHAGPANTSLDGDWQLVASTCAQPSASLVISMGVALDRPDLDFAVDFNKPLSERSYYLEDGGETLILNEPSACVSEYARQ